MAGEIYWKCQCKFKLPDGKECGNIFSLPGKVARSDYKLACGKHPELNPSYKHGFATNKQDTFYSEWSGIKYRCKHVEEYIERGMDERWNDFINFKEDMYDSYLEAKKTYGDKISIDRIDNSKGYSKDNCRWTDSLHQQNNTSKSSLYNYNGNSYNLTEIYDRYKVDNISFLEFRNNVKMGEPIAYALQDKALRANARTPVTFHNELGYQIEDPATGRIK